MSKIRKLYYFDKKNVQEMISFLNNNVTDNYINYLMFNPVLPLHYFLPLGLKFLPESYVLKDGNEIKSLITVAPIGSKNKKMEIQKLFFDENSVMEAAELVQYAVSKYKAMGAFSIIVKVDDYLPNLLSMFVTKCGFSQISYEKLWRVTKFPEIEFNKKDFRIFRNSDAQAVAGLYNDILLPHFRPLLSKEVREFKEGIFKGLSYFNEYKYVLEDEKTKNIVACIVIQTYDNENFIVDIIQNGWFEYDINEIIAYTVDRIKKRKKRFGLFIKSKKYTNLGEKFDKIFQKNKYECVQNQIVLTNSSARILKGESEKVKYAMLSNLCPANTIPTTKSSL